MSLSCNGEMLLIVVAIALKGTCRPGPDVVLMITRERAADRHQLHDAGRSQLNVVI